ncbi:MAG TPA: chloride channel protein [Gemmatimonadaceae bacterium]|nr:chloride channel protein [Gemmatimonadaceae bacterium]
MTKIRAALLGHPLVRKYTSLVHEDLSATYTRDLHKWLIIAPVMGVVTGLLITLLAKTILVWMWPPVLRVYLAHPFVMIPGVAAGFIVAGLIMQHLTPDPDEHSTEEVIRSYHEHQGAIDVKPFVPKLVAAIATVGLGGSAALEGPSIYGGGALGSWLWTRLRGVGLEPRDRRIMLIAGAAAGMSAVFRAPLTGIVFALEMPYKDDLAHEALLPALIASVTSYATMAAFLGATPLFDFATAAAYTRRDLLWSAVLGLICGLATMVFTITFRRARGFAVRAPVPHWVKMAVGGTLTGIVGLGFVSVFHGALVPIGPNYEAVPQLLQQVHGSALLVAFGIAKLIATLFSLGVGGVSAAFVPLFLAGGSFGTAFAQSVVHSASPGIFAAVGMAAFIAGGYKAPLTAVIFVAEATGGHAYIVPALIGAAVAYAVSGESSMSGDQKLHEIATVAGLSRIRVREVMRTQVIAAYADRTLRQFAERIGAQYAHAAYPVYDADRVVGTISMRVLGRVKPQAWDETRVGDVMDRDVVRVPLDCDLQEALRLMMTRHGQPMLLVSSSGERLEGILTKTDILSALDARGTTNADAGIAHAP